MILVVVVMIIDNVIIKYRTRVGIFLKKIKNQVDESFLFCSENKNRSTLF